MSLLDALLAYSTGLEDPITEMLAWFLRTSAPVRGRVLDASDVVARRHGASLPRLPDQTSTRRSKPPRRSCRR
jgi:hypothetical protein